MFPMVPYYSLPSLHKAIRADLPPAYKGLWETYHEIVPTLLRQLKDPSYYVVKTLPASATPIPASPPRLSTDVAKAH